MQADGITPVAGGTVEVSGIGQAVRLRQVNGLVSGAQYRFEVLAVNGLAPPLGASAPSVRSALVTAARRLTDHHLPRRPPEPFSRGPARLALGNPGHGRR